MNVIYMHEIWKDIEGYEGLYLVSNLGNVKSLNYRRTVKEMVLLQCTASHGYKSVLLCKNGIRKHFLVHRLVVCTFNNISYDSPLQVDHIDTDKANNNLMNLRLCTHKENMNNTTTLLNKRKDYYTKIQKVCVLIDYYTGKEIKRFESLKECACYLGVSKLYVGNYIRKGVIFHKKYRIEYV